MKKILSLMCVAVLLLSCAEEKTFHKSDGSTVTAEPYGWMNQSRKVNGVVYDINVGNAVIDCLFIETGIVPLLLTGIQLWEPVKYIEPSTNVTDVEQ